MSSGSQGSTLLSLISACTRFPIHLAVIAGGCPLSLSHKLSAQYISFQNLGRKWIHPGAQMMFSRGVIISMLIVTPDILIFSYFAFWWVSSRLYFVVIYIISHVGVESRTSFTYYSMNILFTFIYFLLYPTIDSALARYYLDYSFIMVSSSYSKLRRMLITCSFFWIHN